MVEADATLAARIAVIKQEFLARLKDEWVPNLRALRQRFLADPANTAVHAELRQAAHDMSGSGAVFGYQTVSSAGRRLEDSVRTLAAADIANDPEGRETIVTLIDELEAICVATQRDIKSADDQTRS